MRERPFFLDQTVGWILTRRGMLARTGKRGNASLAAPAAINFRHVRQITGFGGQKSISNPVTSCSDTPGPKVGLTSARSHQCARTGAG